jgi:hypothetical protein
VNPLGEDLLPLLVLALGGAMAVGNLVALVRPPERPREEGDLARAPVGRSVLFVAIGLVASLWAIRASGLSWRGASAPPRGSVAPCGEQGRPAT